MSTMITFNPPYDGVYTTNSCTPYTNAGYRVAFLAAMIRGANDVESLLPFSNHVLNRSDDGESLRGAIGPRLRMWVGVDQYKEMIDANMDVFEEQDYVKPKGVDQLACVTNDLAHGLPSAVVVRDPSLDFDTSDDIPDLISVTFSVTNDGKILNVEMNYATCDGEEHPNEVWAFNILSHMIASSIESVRRVVVTVNGAAGEPMENSNVVFQGIGDTSKIELMRGGDLDDAFYCSKSNSDQLSLFMDACMHARMLFGRDSLDNMQSDINQNWKHFSEEFLNGQIKCMILHDSLLTMVIFLILAGRTQNTGDYHNVVNDASVSYYMRWLYDEMKSTASTMFNYQL